MPRFSQKLWNRWLFDLEAGINAQPELNQAGRPMATHDRATRLLQLFVAAARSHEPIDRRLTLYVAWGLKSADPACALGLKRPQAGGTGDAKMTDAEREEFGELIAQRIAEEERKRARKRGSAHQGDLGSLRERVINQFAVNFPDLDAFALPLEEFEAKHTDKKPGLSTRTVETLLTEWNERRSQEKRLTSEVPSGPSATDALPVPEEMPLDPAALLELLNKRGVLKRWLPD